MEKTMFSTWILSFLLLSTFGVLGGKVPTVYDVLQLVYQVCSTDEYSREQSLACVSDHMGKEVVSVVELCMVDTSQTPNETHSVKEFCEHLTHVPEWVAKHTNPPPQLTRVMGLAALGRMACVLGEVQRPLPMWQAAFAKCFPDFTSSAALSKEFTSAAALNTERTKNRSDNSIIENGD